MTRLDRARARQRQLTIRFLEARAGTASTKLFRFATTRVCHKEGSVVGEKQIFQLLLGCLVNEFLVVRNDALGNSLADSVDLRGVTASTHAQANVNICKALLPQDQKRFEHLDAKALGLQQVQWGPIELHQPLPIASNMRNGDCSFLAAEALNRVLRRNHVGTRLDAIARKSSDVTQKRCCCSETNDVGIAE
jgi:hypothetical protein